MFDRVNKTKFKRLLIWKYFFQLVIFPILVGLLYAVFAFFAEVAFRGWDTTVRDMTEVVTIWFLTAPLIVNIVIIWTAIALIVNILSVIPFIKLIIDTISKDDEITKEIEVTNVFLPYELQCVRQSKRFIWDTFSRKTNIECFIYDENKTKYRFFWNESYSSTVKDADPEICRAKRLKISYFKRSRIIFRCEVTETDEPFAPQQPYQHDPALKGKKSTGKKSKKGKQNKNKVAKTANKD